jgi:hypothetical protein
MITEIVKVSTERLVRLFPRCVGLLPVSCFFVGMIALAMHHHEVSFQLKSCGICKAKTFLSATLNRVNADLPLATAAGNLWSEELYFTDFRIKNSQQAPFIASLLTNTFLNKAPPAIT